MIKFWGSLSQSAKISFISGLVFILALTAFAGFWLLRVDYQVLFSDLKPQDSAVMVAELDRLKIPYRISEGGNAILVDKEIVHATRLKLLGKDLPLHGVVGLELFNNSDFGMTEFAQKINYQRALQGEITRTISSLEEIQDVRVHLALPEEGLFKRATSKAKAAITLALKPGYSLRSEQVAGIQRLVAAAVPGIAAQDVTIVDKKGVALTRPVGSVEQDFNAGSLELKKETEALLSKKVNQVLNGAFGENQASASVDVILNMDQIKVTMDDVLAAPTAAGQVPTGVIIKDKESSRDLAAPLDAALGGQSAKSGTFLRETEYQVGRRSEQIVSQPGAIRRISAVAVIHKELNDAQKEQIKSLVSAAVGASLERGDTIVIQSTADLLTKTTAVPSEESVQIPEKMVPMEIAKRDVGAIPELTTKVILMVLVIVISLVFFFLYLLAKTKKVSKKTMNDAERAQALLKIQEWLARDFESKSNSQNRGV